MRKLLASAIVLPLALLVLQAPASAKSSKMFFDGTTKQGVEVFFIVENIGGAPTFEPFFTNFTITCNGTSFNYEWLFFGYQIPLDQNGGFDISLPSDQLPFDWNGTVNGNKAHGTQSQGYAAYNSQGGGVADCGTGPVGWKATGVSGRTPSRHTSDWTVTVVKDSKGRVSETIRHG